MRRIRTDRHQVVSNYQARDILYWQDLTEQERADLDYVKEPDDWSGFRYRGATYDLSDFMRLPPYSAEARAGWQGYSADSVLVAYTEDQDAIIAGLALI